MLPKFPRSSASILLLKWKDIACICSSVDFFFFSLPPASLPNHTQPGATYAHSMSIFDVYNKETIPNGARLVLYEVTCFPQE